MTLSFVAGFMLSSVLLLAQGVQAQEAPKVHSMTGCFEGRTHTRFLHAHRFGKRTEDGGNSLFDCEPSSARRS